MNEIRVSSEELAEVRLMVAKFRQMGASEHDACMVAAQVQIALRGKP